jgi:hypothetical protein
MARDTELVNGIHVISATVKNHSTRVTVPKPMSESLAISSGTYLGVRRIGDVIVFAKITNVTPEGATAEMNKAFERAIKAWEKCQ